MYGRFRRNETTDELYPHLRSKDVRPAEVTVKTQDFELIFDGMNIKLLGSVLILDDRCGLCGNVQNKQCLFTHKCMRHHHDMIDGFSRNETCFSRIPMPECGFQCNPFGVREKSVSFTW